MKRFASLLAVFALATHATASTITWESDGSDGWTAGDDWDADNIDAIKTAVDDNDARIVKQESIAKYADPSTPGTTTAGIAEALAECGSGIGGGSVSQGCTVQLACNTDEGGLDISETVTVGGITTETSKVGVRIIGCGTGVDNSDEDIVGGSTLNWSGGADPVIVIDGCSGCSLEDFGIRGDNDATGGVVLRGTASPTSFTSMLDVRFEDINGYAIEIDGGDGDDDQVDNIHMERVSIRDSTGCYLQDSEQSLNNTFLEGECSSAVSDPLPSGTMFNIAQGNITIAYSYFGIRGLHSPAIDIGRPAFAYILGNSFEFHRTSGVAITSDGTGGSGGNNDATTVVGNKFLVLNTGATCVDWDRQGALVFSGNVLIGQGSGIDAGCVLNAANSADGDDIFVTSFGNSHRTLFEAADFVAAGVSSGLEYGLLPWSTDSDAFVSQPNGLGNIGILPSAEIIIGNGTSAPATAVLSGDVAMSAAGAVTIQAGAVEASMVAADVATQAELDAKSAATSTDNAVPKFDSTAGDVQNSGVLIDDSNNLTVPGSITSGTSGGICIVGRDIDDGGDTACHFLNGAIVCEADTNGVCNDAT